MAHPTEDVGDDGRCKHCGDRLSKVIVRKGAKLAYRRHLTNPDCEKSKGKGEPVR